MSLIHSPSIVTKDLLLNLDFKNPKKFKYNDFGTNNLCQYPTYNSSYWSYQYSLPAQGSVLTTGIDAPDGSKNAIRITSALGNQTLLRVDITDFTPNGTDIYVLSFWVRKISGTVLESNTLYCDLSDQNSYEYSSQLITNKWVRITTTFTPTAVGKSFIDLISNNACDYVLDFWGVKLENYTASTTSNSFPIKDTVGGYTFNLYHPQYYILDTDYVQFTRSASAPKHGGVAYTTTSGRLLSSNFLYNNHTWEIWVKINDINPAAYDGTEGYSCLANYQGYHSGFQYTASALYYYIWDNVTLRNGIIWTVGTTGAQINQGQWYQIVAVREGNTFTPYVNGTQLGSGYTYSTAISANVTNELFIGAGANVSPGASSYIYYSKANFANMKMYNRALSATEVSQNFNALRGRFGI